MNLWTVSDWKKCLLYSVGQCCEPVQLREVSEISEDRVRLSYLSYIVGGKLWKLNPKDNSDLCLFISELPDHRSSGALWLFLRWQVHDWVSHWVWEANETPWRLTGAFPPCCFSFPAGQTRPPTLPWQRWQVRVWCVLEQVGPVLRVLLSRERPRPWSEVRLSFDW